MAITNKYLGFTVATTADFAKADNDSDFGINRNRNIRTLNQANPANISNKYSEGYVNQFGSAARFSTNEQNVVQNIITETIHINGLTTRYMPRYSPNEDRVWNEMPEGTFHRGFQIDAQMVDATGLQGEGATITQFGIEFREEVVLSISIQRFNQYSKEFYENLRSIKDSDNAERFIRQKPEPGDCFVVPFGRTSINRNQYLPKVFEVMRVDTFRDSPFFQLGDNYEYRVTGRLFELSGENMQFKPTVIEYDYIRGTQQVIIDSDTGIVASNNKGLDSENAMLDSDGIWDVWGDNRDIEIRSQKRTVTKGDKTETQTNVVSDMSAKAFGYSGIINNLDDI